MKRQNQFIPAFIEGGEGDEIGGGVAAWVETGQEGLCLRGTCLASQAKALITGGFCDAV